MLISSLKQLEESYISGFASARVADALCIDARDLLIVLL
jgi:hypothetical protein